MNKGITIYLICLYLPVVSCTFINGSGKIPLACVDQNVLYLSELQSIIPKDISIEDSILIAEDYIKNWINNELMIKKAQENLTISQKDLAKEIKEYKNSLIIYRYQQQLMEQKLDTLVSEEEIVSFYDSVREDFRLNIDLIKAVSVRIPLEVEHPERVKAFCESSLKQNLEELRLFCTKNGGFCDLNTEDWVDSRSVFQNLPYQPGNISGFLAKYTTWESRDSRFYYLVRIMDYAQAGTYAPVEYIRENLKEMIINKRKSLFLLKIKEDVYTEGTKNNKFKIYDYETN
jgi:hypothetical protein